jgi:uncharacterized coiled-coil protein SlyX
MSDKEQRFEAWRDEYEAHEGHAFPGRLEVWQAAEEPLLARIAALESRLSQQARTIASMCQQVGDLESRADNFEVVLRDIVRADPVEMALDPTWAMRIAKDAISREYP